VILNRGGSRQKRGDYNVKRGTVTFRASQCMEATAEVNADYRRQRRALMRVVFIQDRDGSGSDVDGIRRRFPWLIWADGRDNAWQVDAVAKVPRLGVCQ
jgi:hypothetical protein